MNIEEFKDQSIANAENDAEKFLTEDIYGSEFSFVMDGIWESEAGLTIMAMLLCERPIKEIKEKLYSYVYTDKYIETEYERSISIARENLDDERRIMREAP